MIMLLGKTTDARPTKKIRVAHTQDGYKSQWQNIVNVRPVVQYEVINHLFILLRANH